MGVPGSVLRQRRSGYASDLKAWFAWCAQVGFEPLAVLRVHIEFYARWMEEDGHLARATIGRRLSTVVGFYRFAVIDGHMAQSPAEHVRRPKINGVGDARARPHGARRFMAQATASWPVDHAVACLLGLLGLRVSEARRIDIEHLGSERGHRTVTVLGMGARVAVIPLPPSGGPGPRPGRRKRLCRPVLLSRSGKRLDRHGATRIVPRVAYRAGCQGTATPHGPAG